MQSNQVSQQYFNSQQLHRNQNNINYFLDPSLQFAKSELQSRSSQQSSLLNNQIDSPTITELRQHKKLMQIFINDIKNKDNLNNYLTEQVKKNKDNLEEVNSFVQKQNLMLLNNKQKQSMMATFNDLKTKINEKHYKTSRLSQTNDDKKKSKSQHQQIMPQNAQQQLHLNQQCTYDQCCQCIQCQIKAIQEKQAPQNFHKKQDDDIIGKALEQKSHQAKSLNYSTQDNCQKYPDILQDHSTQNINQINRYLNYQQKNTLSKNVLRSQNEQFQDSNTFNLPESSRNSLSGSTFFNDAINQKQQVMAQEVLQSDFCNQQQNVSKEQMLSQMCDQNTQLQQLVKDQQDYIQILYKEMIWYQSLLDHYKIPYIPTKNILHASESNFSLQGSTAAPSPVISQLCHSSRVSELGQLDLIDSSNSEQQNQYLIQDKNQQIENFKQQYEQFSQATADAKLIAIQQQQNAIFNEGQGNNAKHIDRFIQNNFFNTIVEDQNQYDTKNKQLKSIRSSFSPSNLLNNSSNEEKSISKQNPNSIGCLQQRRKSIFNQNSNQIQIYDSNMNNNNNNNQSISSKTVANRLQKHHSNNQSPVKLYQDIQNLCLSTQNLDKQMQNHYMINSARNFSTASPQINGKSQIDIHDLMKNFKNRFSNFLSNLKKKSVEKSSQFGRKNMLMGKNLLEKSAISNNLRQQMFMSPQCSPLNKNNSQSKQIINQEQFSAFQQSLQRKNNQQYFSSLNKIIESQKLTHY
ncbi:hypothetical protein ABPG74_008849 [Tetrahymena malaccensis]